MKREKEERDDVEEDARISLLPLHSYRHGETLPISRRIESAVEESSSSFSFCLRALVSLFFVSSLFSFWYRRYMKKKGQKEEEKERRRKSNDLSKRVKEEHKKRHTRRGVGRGEKGKEKEEKKEREEEEKREEEEEREEEVVEESELQKIFRGLGRAIILTLLSFTLFLLLAVTSLCGFSDISLISTKGSSKEIKL
ncbi:hypothetical protein CSUI_010364 [Cystoisospora suis]|uniref:Transmembrane protein n=1 Tax=Cystoisospora suis TaxID=483139 RepID=A0A2C6KHF5_9APIC|nr:hypothetical protein CSUI_010364 [Cystoisospora suis]